MKAIHKYKKTARTNKEHQRRIAQSLGYRFSIWDMPKMITLLARAGINLTDDRDLMSQSLDYTTIPDTKTLKL